MYILLITVILGCWIIAFLVCLWTEVRRVHVVAECWGGLFQSNLSRMDGSSVRLRVNTSVCREGIKPICLTIHKVQILAVLVTSGSTQRVQYVAVCFIYWIFLYIPARILVRWVMHRATVLVLHVFYVHLSIVLSVCCEVSLSFVKGAYKMKCYYYYYDY